MATVSRKRNSRKRSADERHQLEQESLNRAVSSSAWSNYPAIIAGFIEKGIPADQIIPRENVFTFNAWRALGRTVRKGEHGVKVCSWIPCESTDKLTGAKETKVRPVNATVFHISQTEALEGGVS